MTPTELIETVRAGLDRDEAEARNSLCINCGEPTKPLRSESGFITGFTHGGPKGSWQGIRCPGRLTGAEPLQRWKRVLADVAARRALFHRVLVWPHTLVDGDQYYSCSQARDSNGLFCCGDEDRIGHPCDCGRNDYVRDVLECLAAPYQEGE